MLKKIVASLIVGAAAVTFAATTDNFAAPVASVAQAGPLVKFHEERGKVYYVDPDDLEQINIDCYQITVMYGKPGSADNISIYRFVYIGRGRWNFICDGSESKSVSSNSIASDLWDYLNLYHNIKCSDD